MIVNKFKTNKIKSGDNIYKILDKYLPKLEEKDVVVITSKIISICQGAVVKNDGKISKVELLKKEAQFYLPEKYIKYGVHLTITNNALIASAGIDESNGNGYFILWPKLPMDEAEKIWMYLRKKFNLNNLGIVITDSHGMILRRGLIGFGLAWCGFEPLKDYIGTPDIFGKILNVSKSNIVDGLAATAVLEMGEGNEQTPLAVIKETNFVKFTSYVPTKKEIEEINIKIEDDIYSALLTSVRWEKGNKK